MSRSYLASLLTLLLCAALPAAGFTAHTHVQIGWEAARLAPPDLYRQILKHRLAFRDGLIEPLQGGQPSTVGMTSGELLQRAEGEAQRAVNAIRSHRPFEDIVRQLGVAVHYTSLINNPLFVSDEDPGERSFGADYLRYIQSAEARFPTLFYGIDEKLRGPQDVAAFLRRSEERSRALYAKVGDEYARIGGPSGIGRFDDRSTAFGVASVAFNRAMSDAVVVLRYVWIEAGDYDPVPRNSRDEDTLLKLPRASE